MWGMTVGTDEGVGKSHTVLGMHNWGHSLQINLVHDAVAGGDDIDVFKCGFGPVYKMKAVVISTILNGSIFLKGVFLKTSVLYRERMVDNQLWAVATRGKGTGLRQDRRLLPQSRLEGRQDQPGQFGQECHDRLHEPETMESRGLVCAQ